MIPMLKRTFVLLVFFIFCTIKADFVDQVLNNSVDVQRKKALFEAREGNYSKALKLIDRAIKNETRDKSLVRCDKLAILVMAGRYKAALELYRKKIPKDYYLSESVRQLVGQIMYHNKHYRQAIAFLKDNTEGDKGLKDMLISSYIAMGQAAKAFNLAESDSEKNRVMHLYGVYLARKGHYVKAEKSLKQAWLDSGKPVSILYDRIVNCVWAGKNKDALHLYKLVPVNADIPEYAGVEVARMFREDKQYQKSNDILKRYMASTNIKPVVRQLFFANLLSMKKLSEAEKFMQKSPKDKTQMSADLQSAFRMEGVRLARAGKYDQANVMFDKALKLEGSAGEIAKINYDRLAAASWAGKYQLADDIFKQIDNTIDLPYYVRIEAAKSTFELGKTAQAEKLARESLAQHKDNRAALGILIKCYLRKEDYNGALKILDQHKKLKPDYMPLVIRSMQDKAIQLGRKGKYGASLKLLDHALVVSDNSLLVIGDKVIVLSWAGKYQQAIDIFEKLSPGQRMKLPPYVLSSVAGSYRQIRKTDHAVKYYTELLKKDPSDADSAIALVSILAYSGSEDEAKKFIAQRVVEYPSEKEKLIQELNKGLRDFAVMTARRGNIGRALAVLRQLMLESPDNHLLRCDYATILAWDRQSEKAIEIYNKLPEGYKCPVYVLNAIAGAYRSCGKYMKAAETYDRILDSQPDNMTALRGAVSTRIEAGKEQEALKLIENHFRIIGHKDAEYTALLGYAYYEVGQTDKAEKIYHDALKLNPHSVNALAGLARVMARRKKWEQAIKYAKEALKYNPESVDALYTYAESLEATDDLTGSYECYDKISKLPGGEPANDAKYRILSSLGAAGLALDMLKENNQHVSQPVYEQIIADRASIVIQQRDTSRAQRLLKRNLYNADMAGSSALRVRSSYDRIIASEQSQSMRQIVKDYEKMLKCGDKTPYWIDELAAEAYLYLRQAKKALRIYRIAEEKQRAAKAGESDWVELQFAIYYCYVELEDFKKAEKVLDTLEKKIPPYTWQGKPNWNRLSIAVERAWVLMFQDRLAEAERYLSKLSVKAPNNIDVLNAEAYLHYYRGWPRRAEKDFRMINTLDPDNRQARIGLCYTMNENDQWREARAEAARLKKQYPADLSVARLNRTLELDKMRTESIYFDSSLSKMVSDGFTLSQRFDQPIYPNRTIYVESVWKYIKKGDLDNDDLPGSRHIFRNGAGVDWRIYRDLTLTAGFTIDYKGEEPGWKAGFEFSPDDHITITGNYDSYSLDAPGGILLDDGSAQKYSVVINYRKSEDFFSYVDFSQMFVSDNNIVTEIVARQDKAITTGAYWRTRLAFEQSLAMNSVIGDDYYAPRYNIMLYVIPYVEHVWYRHYESSFTDRLYIAPGLQLEANYSPNFAGYIRYEFEWILTDTISFLAGSTGSLRNYDGDSTYGLSFDAGLIFRF